MKALYFVVLQLFAACRAFTFGPDENPNLFEGDMILRPDQERRIRGLNFGFAATSVTKPWPLPIAYVIDKSLEKSTFAIKGINNAIKEFEKHTCIRFKKRQMEKEYFIFYKGRGCHSFVGYYKDQYAPISIGSGCTRTGYVMHEMAHALGFYHEQSRPDRDKYVTILWDNIPKFLHGQFKNYSHEHVDSMGVPYDYMSIMHYNRHQFSGSKPSINATDPRFRYKIGQRRGLSVLDTLQLNLMYKCPGVTRPPPGFTAPPPPTRPPPRPSTKKPPPPPPTQPPTTLPPTTSAHQSMVICENRGKSISCPSRTKLVIISAFYGRNKEKVCPTTRIKDYNCSLPTATDIIRKKCAGRRKCWLPVTRSLMKDDPCKATTKFLKVVYTCISF